MTSLKIAYIAPSFPPELGGMGSACYYTANEVGKSHDVTVFVIDRGENYKTGNYRIEKLKPWFSYGYGDFTPSILKAIKKFDIIHLYYPYFGIAELLILFRIFNKNKFPKIILHQEMDMVGKGIKKFLNNIHKKILLNWLFKNSDLNFVLSEDYAKHSDIKKIFKKYPDKFKVIPNGVDTDKFKVESKKLKVRDKNFTIFTAQALDKQHFFKGIEVLIKAVKLVVRSYQLDVKLIIAGDGDLKKYYEELVKKLNIEKHVKFLGKLNHEQLPKYYSQANLVAVPSTQRTESFSITAAESMACGTPVIVSNWPGLRVTIKNKVTGLICQPNNIKDLAQKIKYLYDHPEELEKMSQASRKRAIEKFDWKNIAEKCIKYYSKLMQKSQDPSPTLRRGSGQAEKIGLIASIYKPYTRGGAETIFNNIVDGFKNSQHDIFIITLCPWQGLKSLFPRKYTQNNLKIYRFYALNLFSYINTQKYAKRPILRLFWHFFDMFNLHSYLVIKHILKQEKPDVVMTHNLKGIGYTVPRAIKKCHIKHIHTVHYVGLSTPSGLILKGQENSWQHTFFLTKLYQIFNRWLFNSPSIIISSSKFLLDFYTKRKFFPKSKKMVVTNPMNISCHPEDPDLASGDEGSRKSKPHEFNFLFVGQIEEYKGILLLINVFKKLLSQTQQKINLLIAGTGSALAKAKKLAGKNQHIKFLDYVDNTKLNKLFVQANVLVIPSLCYENSPTVIFESLSYGTPVLAARIGGIEFIKDNYNGFTFEAGDEQDLLRVMQFALENKKQLADMSTNCLKSVKNIGVENYIRKLENLI